MSPLPLADAQVTSPAAPTPLGAPPVQAPVASKPLIGAGRAQLPPPISDVAAGRLAGITAPPINPTNVSPLMAKLLDMGLPALEAAGIGMYETKKSETVFFNPSMVDAAGLRQAEANGTLYEVAPPLNAGGPAKPQAAAAPQSAPLAQAQSSAYKAPPAALQTSLSNARTKNITNPAGGRPMSPVAPNPVTQRLSARLV